jgi:hypothetical protein
MSFFSKLAHMVSMLCHSNIKLARSITEQEKLLESLSLSEEKIKADEQFLQDIFSSIKDGLSILDLDRNISHQCGRKFRLLLSMAGNVMRSIATATLASLSVEHTCNREPWDTIEFKFSEGDGKRNFSYPYNKPVNWLAIEYVRDVTEQKA